MTLPEHTRRLFFGYRPADLLGAEHRPFLIGRLLEEGDSEDLRWLTARLGEAELGAWLEASGGRQLSRRGRAFWSLLLGRAQAGEAPGRELWQP